MRLISWIHHRGSEQFQTYLINFCKMINAISSFFRLENNFPEHLRYAGHPIVYNKRTHEYPSDWSIIFGTAGENLKDYLG
jgi:hypothetical protein